jgi:predicted RNA-binding protein with PUA-like domain
MQYWLVKQEPEDYSWVTFAKERKAAWTGVRSFPARKNLRGMHKGDLVLFYHSGSGKEVVGVARVLKEAYPDPTDKQGEWVAVDLEPVKALGRPVTLTQIRADSTLKEILLVRQSRLSVMPLTGGHFDRILSLGETNVR